MAGKAKGLTKTPDIQASNPVVLELWVRSGGRCEFHGCNEYLLEDSLTTNKLKLSNIAHIVARSKDGSRGDDPLPFEERNNIENLMLVCTKCHLVIDNKKIASQYPKEILFQYKKDHESRIRYLTEFGVEHETVVLRAMGNIRGDSVSISEEEIRTAVLGAQRYPRYLGDRHVIELDLQSLPQEVNSDYWRAAIAKTDEVVRSLIVPGIENGRVPHLSIFALARIPILIHLGNAIGDKVVTDFYQRHRDDPVGWKWRQGNVVQFSSQLLQDGSDLKKIALILSLSGKIDRSELPKDIDSQYYIYEIFPVDVEPSRSLVTNKETLNAFQGIYQSLLRSLESRHGKGELHLFSAIPAPVALICGRELLKDVSPRMHVYDRMESGYELALIVN